MCRNNLKTITLSIFCHYSIIVYLKMYSVDICYSLTSPYGHLYNTDTSLLQTVRLVPEMPKILHSLPL